jgi:small subunit ribosomal protein S2
MREITLEELLEAGCHFGHQVTRGNPKARDFVFEARDNIHIIDLAKTKQGLVDAGEFVKSVAKNPESIMVAVGTKRQAKSIIDEAVKKAHATIKNEAVKDELLSVTTKWVGGLLTNFSEVSKNFKKLSDLEEKLNSKEERAKYTKKEIGTWDKEKQKLEGFYGGIARLKKNPDLLFIVDTHLEDLAVLEARKTGVPIVGVVDTNADPTLIDYPIPANDDAVGSIQIIVDYIIDAWIEGKNASKDQKSPVRQAQGKNQRTDEETKKVAKTKKSSEAKSASGAGKEKNGKGLKPAKKAKK